MALPGEVVELPHAVALSAHLRRPPRVEPRRLHDGRIGLVAKVLGVALQRVPVGPDVLRAGATISKPYQTTVMRNSFQLGMHRRCAEVMRRVDPELICPGHRDVIDCSKQQLDEYADFIARKERAFRNLVAEPADHYVDLFWARLLPYLATAKPGRTVEYRLMLRNNLERDATYTAELDPPPGWSAGAPASVRLRAGERGEVALQAAAPAAGDGVRRLVTAQIAVDGQPQGAIAEALVTVACC